MKILFTTCIICLSMMSYGRPLSTTLFEKGSIYCGNDITFQLSTAGSMFDQKILIYYKNKPLGSYNIEFNTPDATIQQMSQTIKNHVVTITHWLNMPQAINKILILESLDSSYPECLGAK